MNDNELLWKMYEDNRIQAQLHEDRRATGTALIAGGAGALITAIFSDGASAQDLPLALMIAVFGAFGWALSTKATERIRFHNARCKVFLVELDKLDSTHNIVAMKEACDKRHRQKHWAMSRLSLGWLWGVLQLLIVVTGVLLVLYVQPNLVEAARETLDRIARRN